MTPITVKIAPGDRELAISPRGWLRIDLQPLCSDAIVLAYTLQGIVQRFQPGEFDVAKFIAAVHDWTDLLLELSLVSNVAPPK